MPGTNLTNGRWLGAYDDNRRMIMKTLKMMLMGFFIVSAPLALMACEDENSVGEAVEEVTDEIDDAT
jgi:hypothetical protein